MRMVVTEMSTSKQRTDRQTSRACLSCPLVASIPTAGFTVKPATDIEDTSQLDGSLDLPST